MSQRSKATDAIIDALAAPAVPNGQAMRPPVRHLPKAAVPVAPVHVDRPPVLAWSCDACPATGVGWRSMQDHVGATGHARFTDIP